MKLDPQWAWEPYRPSDKHPWDLAKAGHLYRRAGFGAKISELEQALAVGPDTSVGTLLSGGPLVARQAFDQQMTDMAASLDYNNEVELRAWWLLRILQTPFPLQERLTLFWHNHFATSNAKVRNLRLYDRPEPVVAAQRARQFSHDARRNLQRPGDDGLA